MTAVADEMVVLRNFFAVVQVFYYYVFRKESSIHEYVVTYMLIIPLIEPPFHNLKESL